MKSRLIFNKKILHDKDAYKGKVFINEDLTTLRSRMLGTIRKSEHVNFAYTRDGKILCNLRNDPERKHMVTVETPDDLFKLGFESIDYDKLGLTDFTAPYDHRGVMRQ